MKKFSYLLLSLLAAMSVLFTSCGEKPEPVGPTINFLTGQAGIISADATIEPGQTFKVKINGTKGDKEMKTLTIKKDNVTISAGLIAELYNDITKKAIEITNGEYTLASSEQDGFTFTITIAPNKEEVSAYEFVATDKDGLMSSLKLNITVKTDATKNYEVKEISSSVDMGAQEASAGSYYSVSKGQVISSVNASVDGKQVTAFDYINFSYAQTGNTTAEITDKFISISERANEKAANNQAGGTDTYFAVSSLDYATATVAQINGITKSSAKKITIEAGKTYEFVTAAGERGLIKVSSISNPKSSTFNGTATISVKVVKEKTTAVAVVETK